MVKIKGQNIWIQYEIRKITSITIKCSILFRALLINLLNLNCSSYSSCFFSFCSSNLSYRHLLSTGASGHSINIIVTLSTECQNKNPKYCIDSVMIGVFHCSAFSRFNPWLVYIFGVILEGKTTHPHHFFPENCLEHLSKQIGIS